MRAAEVFNAGTRGYSGSRGMLGALRARGPRAGLVEELLNMSDAESCAAHLRQSPFLDGIDSGSSLADLQRALRSACVIFGRKLTIFLGGPARRMIETHLLRYGVWNVKVLFRRSVMPAGDGISDDLYPSAACYVPPRQRATIDSPEKVVGLTEGSRLEKATRIAYETYQKGEKDLFLFELALDREYLLGVWDAAQRVNLTEGSRLRRTLIVPGLGLNAIIWGLWLRSYHGMAAEEVMTLLTLPAKLVRTEAYLKFLQTGDPAVVEGAREVTAAGRFLAAAGAPQDVPAWHRLSRRYLWGRLNSRSMGIVFDISSLVMNLMKWEFVVDDAITVVTAKSLGLKREEIGPLLATQAA